MDSFDMDAYFQKRDAEDTYIVNRFIQRQKKIKVVDQVVDLVQENI